MALSWNEIKDRAVRFSKEWENASREEAEAQEFLFDLYDKYTITPPRRRGGDR
jgi:hypothetical protein